MVLKMYNIGVGYEKTSTLTIIARQMKSSHGLRSHDVSNRYDGSQRSVPKEKTPVKGRGDMVYRLSQGNVEYLLSW